MPAISRREFLKQSATDVAVAGFLSVGARELRANPLGLPIGSQTYPHRQRIKDGDFAGLCKDMAALGVGSLELCSPGYAEFASLADAKQTRKIMEDHGLKCPSAHFESSELRTRQQEMIDWAKGIGMTQMGTASLDGPVKDGVTTMDAVEKAIAYAPPITQTIRSRFPGAPPYSPNSPLPPSRPEVECRCCPENRCIQLMRLKWGR